MRTRSSWSLLLGLVLLACGGGDDASDPSEPSEAHRLVEEGATLLDVRTVGEFEAGHIDGAVNIPVSELDARMSEISDDQSVVVYCQSGGRSSNAATSLRAAGYIVHDLGAMASW